MALQLWMPLTKDLRQQGVSNIIPTQTTGYTSIAAGKLGGCYKFTGTFDTLLPFSNWNWTEGSVSFGCWAKISRSELATLVNAQTYDATYNSMGGTLLGRDSYGGLGLRWKTNNIYTDSTLNAVYVYTHIRNTSSSSNNTNTYTIPFDTWFHVMMVLDRVNNKINIYINGELFTSTNLTVTGSFTTGTFRIAEATWDGGNGRGSAGCWQLNDVRVYDSALSPMEIKYIAQGLILHYPLNRNGWGQENLLANTNTGVSYWNWTMQVGDYTRTEETTLSGVRGCKLTRGDTTQSGWSVIYWNLIDESILTISTQYTLSLDIYPSVNTSFNVCILEANGTNQFAPYAGAQTVIANKWNHLVFSLTTVATFPSSTNETLYFTGMNNGTGVSYIFRNLKLEKGSIATPWCPNSSDTLATTTGLNETTEYDCSGFCNNGSKMTDTITYTSDTAKYQVSTHFNGTYDGILIENLQLSDIINTAITYAFWIKPEDESGARSVYFGSYSGNSWSIEKNTGNVIRLYWNGSPDEVCTGATITDNIWQHVCITKNGTNDVKVYINGVQKWTSTTTHNNLIFPTTYRLGRDVRSNDGTPYKGLMSDFRIYATALSADDVKSLYQNCATIDPDGTIRGQIRS